jgi:6-phosphogluconolactonase
MMRGTVRVVPSVPDAFADLVAKRLAQKRDRPYSLFLSGGDTARRSYERLARISAPGPQGAQQPGPDRAAEGAGAADRITVDWTTVGIYMGDERCVPPDDQDSNHHMVTTTLLDAVGPVGSDHPMYRSGTPEEAAAAYQSEVESLDGFDLVHLGLGPDGHCASLFPGSAALAIDDPAQLVSANVDPKGNNPHPRITLTLPGIARARTVVFTISGPSRSAPFAGIVAGDDLPAARVSAAEVIWLVDADAAADAQLPA